MRDEAERDDLDLRPTGGPARSTRTSHNEAVLEARAGAPRADVLAALQRVPRRGRGVPRPATRYVVLGTRRVRSVLGPLPLAHPGRRPAPTSWPCTRSTSRRPERPDAVAGAAVGRAGRAGRHDRCAGGPLRALGRAPRCLTPEGGWAFAAVPGAWTTLELPAVRRPVADRAGRAADLLDASAGRRAVPPMLARRDLRLHHVAGLLALAPIVEAVPGLPGGTALRAAVRNVRGSAGCCGGCPGVPG